MKKSPDINRYRVRTGPLASDKDAGRNKAFCIPCAFHGVAVRLNVIASDGANWHECGIPGSPWEHVSVSLPARCPTWEEMDFVKRLFWRDDETVIQLHVPRDKHINHHSNCLHLWKPVGVEIPLPPPITVGPMGSVAR